MLVKKSGTILLNLNSKQIGLVYRNNRNDYSFPKGHLKRMKHCNNVPLEKLKKKP